MENGTTILFGLPGVAVQLVEWGEPGRLVHVVTTADWASKGSAIMASHSSAVRLEVTTVEARWWRSTQSW
jgi:hypothetical protein